MFGQAIATKYRNYGGAGNACSDDSYDHDFRRRQAGTAGSVTAVYQVAAMTTLDSIERP